MLSSKFDTGRSVDLQDAPDAPVRLPMPGLTGPLSTPGTIQSSSSPSTGHLPVPAAEHMRNLPALRGTSTLTTGHLPTITRAAEPWTTGRTPVVIPGKAKKRSAPQKSSTPIKTKHRMLLHASVVCIIAIFVLTTLATVLPLGGNGQALGVGGLLQHLGVINMVNSNAKNTALVGAQAATATAIMQNDGYDPGKTVSQQYNASLGNVAATGDNFPYGQCTYWADYRYHQLSGYWVSWSGNAYQWAAGAAATPGWVVSYTPHFPSIVVFQPGVQYASWFYGHVGVLESINADGSFTTSNMNVVGRGFGAVANLTNYPGAGVAFVYHQ